MLDIDKIQQLIEMMVSNDLVEISLRDGGEEINLRRPNAQGPVVVSDLAPAAPIPAAAPAPQLAAEPAKTEGADGRETAKILSPMVGTFYSAPDPDSPVFVKVGQEIQVGMVICIVEAMKVFNEIKAEVAGTIERVLVKNAEAVEFGQPLFEIRPA